jgi:hypothetical protein
MQLWLIDIKARNHSELTERSRPDSPPVCKVALRTLMNCNSCSDDQSRGQPLIQSSTPVWKMSTELAAVIASIGSDMPFARRCKELGRAGQMGVSVGRLETSRNGCVTEQNVTAGSSGFHKNAFPVALVAINPGSGSIISVAWVQIATTKSTPPQATCHDRGCSEGRRRFTADCLARDNQLPASKRSG